MGEKATEILSGYKASKDYWEGNGSAAYADPSGRGWNASSSSSSSTGGGAKAVKYGDYEKDIKMSGTTTN